MNVNADIVQTLEDYLSFVPVKTEFDSALISNAIRKLSKFHRRVQSYEDALQNFGISRFAAKLVGRYLKEGKLKEVEEIKQKKKDKQLTLIKDHFCIPHHRALELFDSGICHQKTLRYGHDLLTKEEQIVFALKDDLKLPVLDQEAHRAIKLVEKVARRETLNGVIQLEKGEPNEIVLSFSHPSSGRKRKYLPQFVQALKKLGFLKHEVYWLDNQCVFKGICKEAPWHPSTLEGNDRLGKVTGKHHWLVIKQTIAEALAQTEKGDA